MHKEEYVPQVTPIANIIQNSFIVVPPNSINDAITRRVVADVFIVLTSV